MRVRTVLNQLVDFKGFVLVNECLVTTEGGMRLEISVRPRANARPRCSCCDGLSVTYDHLEERRFRFPALWSIPVFLVYCMRRVQCRDCGVKVEAVPWAVGKSPVTKMLAFQLSDWAKLLSWQEVCERFHVNWHQVYRSVKFVVNWGLEHRDLDGVQAIGIDEIQFGKGHQYLTVVYQLCGATRRLLYVGQRRDAAALQAFFDTTGVLWCGAIKYVCTDMWRAYLKVVRENMPDAMHVLDRFHIVKLLNDAVDKVRRASDQGKALASSSTLNRLELTPADATVDSRYKKVVYHAEAIESLLPDLFLDSLAAPPKEIILDFDATDDPVHGEQEGRFFHGYYRCYCYLPLYVTCGDHLLSAKLRESNQDASAGSVELLDMLVGRIRERWPEQRIIVRGDSGFARDEIMTWCEANQVYYVFGLAKNKRLLNEIGNELIAAHARHIQTGVAARVFSQFWYRTRKSWSAKRRVIAKAEHLKKGPNPRFIVTNLPEDHATPRALYEDVYCARGDMENRIKEQQLDLFADRTSTHTLRANQLRLWFSSMAYVLLSALRRVGLKGTRMAKATCGTIRRKLLKIGAQIKVSVRRFMIHLASACPYHDVFQQALGNIHTYRLRI